MGRQQRIRSRVWRRVFGWLAALGLVAVVPTTTWAQSWPGHARNPQHTALETGPSQIPQVIRWSTPVDLAPQYSRYNGALYAHYGSPVITSKNTVIVPVKTGAAGGFIVNAFDGATGRQIWTMNTDYQVPPNSNWFPPLGITLLFGDSGVAVPGAGGTILVRSSPDSAVGRIVRLGQNNPSVFISTPITADLWGNLYFGYITNGGLGGLSRMTRAGASKSISAPALSGDENMVKVVQNCAPSISADGKSLYVAVNQSDSSHGYLCRLDAGTLAPSKSVLLTDPRGASSLAGLPDVGSGTPTVGPDGDVYFGVLEANVPSHHARGWLLHFDSTLTVSKIPGSFGWDESPAIVPAEAVPSYEGGSSYLVLSKYSDYSDPGIGGSGLNKVAVLDPNASQADPINPQVRVMKEVITVLGVTPNDGQAGVREWCINTAAVDATNKCAIVNSEDGHIYRWSFVTNTLSPGLYLSPATGEAYTPTVIGPDGAVYAINDARLFCCVAAAGSSGAPPGAGGTPPGAGGARPSVGRPVPTIQLRRGDSRPGLLPIGNPGGSNPNRPLGPFILPIALLTVAAIGLAMKDLLVRSIRPRLRLDGTGRATTIPLILP